MKNTFLSVFATAFFLVFGIYFYPKGGEVAANGIPTPSCPSTTGRSQEQLALAGIRVGKSTTEELIAALGEPTEIDSFTPRNQEYIYYDVAVSTRLTADVYLNVQNDIVDQIYLYPNKNLTVQQVINTYGCPDFVFVDSFSEDMDSTYNGGFLVYLKEGIEFQFYGLPLSTKTSTTLTSYFVPTTAELYATTPYSTREEQIVSWAEATNPKVVAR